MQLPYSALRKGIHISWASSMGLSQEEEVQLLREKQKGGRREEQRIRRGKAGRFEGKEDRSK